jgi:quinolinate synthase
MVQSINATTPLEDARAVLAAEFDLKFTRAVGAVTARLYDRLKGRIAEADWRVLAPLIVQINRLKKEKNAAILAHVQQTPEIYYGVADRMGDNLSLLQAAPKIRQATVLVAAVQTMAESIKLLLPAKLVLNPDSRVRSTLAAAIAPEDVQAIRGQHPGVPVAAHINAALSVKAMADVCFTAANALSVIDAVEGDRVIMLPDQFIAQHVAKVTEKKVITWGGSCDVYGAYTADDVAALRAAHPKARIVAHPQNPPGVTAVADFTGTTAAVAAWLETEKPAEVILLGDGAAAGNFAIAAPETTFIPSPRDGANGHRITLETILWSLHANAEEVTIPADLATPASTALQRMLAPGKKLR